MNLLGGIFEDQDQKSFTGIPGLGQIPVLKYIFGSEKIDHTKNEVVFVLIPHLVRDQDVTDLNLRPIDVVTDSAIDLRLAPNRPGRGGQGEAPTPQSQLQQSRPAVPASAAPANPAATTGVAQAPAPANPAPAPSPQETATPAAQPVLRFDPPSITTTNRSEAATGSPAPRTSYATSDSTLSPLESSLTSSAPTVIGSAMPMLAEVWASRMTILSCRNFPAT